MIIKLQTCTVRSFRKSDAESIARHANNRNVWINVRDHFPHPYNIADARRWLDAIVNVDPETHFAIAVNDMAVGGIGIGLQNDVERISAEIGYWLSEAYWGRGIATEAVVAVTDYAFRHHDLTRIFAVPFADNPASVRVLEKAGYVLEGTMRRAAIKDGTVLDQLLYATYRDGA